MGVPEFSRVLCFSYGKATFQREGHVYQGTAVLTPCKLYLKTDGGNDISATFVPLEKVYRIRAAWNTMELDVRPSNFMHFKARLKMSRKDMISLLKDLVNQRGLTKKFLGLEWHDPNFFNG